MFRRGPKFACRRPFEGHTPSRFSMVLPSTVIATGSVGYARPLRVGLVATASRAGRRASSIPASRIRRLRERALGLCARRCYCLANAT